MQESSTTLVYQNKLEDNGNLDTYLKINSIIELKSGIFSTLLDSLNYLLSYIPKSLISPVLLEEVHYLNNNKEKFSLSELENRRYLFDLDINFITRPLNITRAQINNFSLFSHNTGFRLTSEYKLIHFKEFESKGIIVFNNYSKPTTIITNYLFNLGKFRNFSQESKEVYKETITDFLKTISDHPNSNSEDLSFEYSLKSNNIQQSKIGTIEINKILPLYYLTLYNKATSKIRSGEKLEERILELVPDFTEHPEFLKQLIIQPKLLDKKDSFIPNLRN